MRALFIVLVLLNLPTLALASSCEDSEIYNETLLSSAIEHLLSTYGAEAVKQPVEKCTTGPGALWRLALASHEEDEHFQYYRVVSCTPAPQDASALQCRSTEGRRLKYQDQVISASNDGTATDFIHALNCFAEALSAGKIKISKYNSLLDTYLSIPLSSKQEISAIAAQPQFQRFIVKALDDRYRFSVELDKEFGCFIDPLRS
ncbi:hypothetical protein [Zhongshania sp.]|uniref:hypothetical protein n=1 Tax=Zhongshania sp. TaxID=1971902 RepID=UPI00356B3EB8